MTSNCLRAACAVLFVLGAGAAAAETTDVSVSLVEPISDYKLYVSEKTDQLMKDTTAFVAAIKAGDIAKAKSLYGPTRMSYEAIEPIAELFSDLDTAIDTRADDFEKKEADPAFTGFHRLEYGLWEKNSTDGLAPIADKLLTDVTDLNKRIAAMTFPPDKVVGGAAALMEEVAATKISGEEDRYSHTDLFDFQANTDGSEKIFVLVEPLIEKSDPTFVEKVSSNFKDVHDTLAKYKSDSGYETYEKLTEADIKVLKARVNTLAEDLSTLRGKLGLN